MSDTLVNCLIITVWQNVTAKLHADKFYENFAENFSIPPASSGLKEERTHCRRFLAHNIEYKLLPAGALLERPPNQRLNTMGSKRPVKSMKGGSNDAKNCLL